jgi:kinetochore protein Fta7
MKKESEDMDINDSLLPDPAIQDVEAYKFQNDREMFPLTEQLQQHLRSMDANAQLIAQIPEWMATAKEAVEDVLREAEDGTLYDKAMSVF